MNQGHSDLGAIQERGYVVARAVFSRQEVSEARTRMRAAFERLSAQGQIGRNERYEGLQMMRGDVCRMTELCSMGFLVFDPRVIALVRRILGANICYAGDSTAQIGEGPRGFHKDNADREDATGVDWSGEYGLIRVGIYLQDHVANSGGLKVRRGSHRYVSRHRGLSENVESGAGDVVFWYLTTTHSGNAVRLKLARAISLHPRLESVIPRSLRAPESDERMSIFCTFARPGQHLERYLSYQAARRDMSENWKHCGYVDELPRWLSARGVEFRRPGSTYGTALAVADQAALADEVRLQ